MTCMSASTKASKFTALQRVTAIKKLQASKNSMANFETVKMLAKEISFLLENVFRIRFYLHGKLYY